MPLCSILIRGILRILPDFAPWLVSTITGLPFCVPPSAPLVASYNSTCRRTRSLGLGSYSPLRGILKLSLSKPVPFFSCVFTVHSSSSWSTLKPVIASQYPIGHAVTPGPDLICRTSAEPPAKSFASAFYKLHLADVDRNQHRIRNSMSSPVVSVDSSLSRNFDPIDIAIVVGVVQTSSGSENIYRILMPTQKTVMPEVGDLLLRVGRDAIGEYRL